MDTVVLLPTSPEGLVVVVRRLRRVAAAPVPVLLVALVRLRRTKRRTRRGAITMTTTSTKRGSLWEILVRQSTHTGTDTFRYFDAPHVLSLER